MSEEQTEQKRISPRPPLDVECSLDPGVPAVFYCSRCHKPFCADCIGAESGSKTYCLQCTLVNESEEEASGQKQRLFKKHGNLILKSLAVIAIVISCFNLYYLFNDYQQGDSEPAFVVEADPQLEGILACRHRMEMLAAEAARYRSMVGMAPESIEALRSILPDGADTDDPVSSMPYVIEHDQSGVPVIHCPDPESHGVEDISASPGRPAHVIYYEERS